jgi:hypothetical protein
MNPISRPEGIEQHHVHGRHSRLHAWPTSLILFALVILAAGVGLFGARATVTAAGSGVRLSVDGPIRIRSGEFFEMRFTVATERELRDAVLSIAPQIWHEVTINTMIPEPTEQDFAGGAFNFHFGALASGSQLVVKVDGQINPEYPPGMNRGAVVLADGVETLAAIDYEMRVLP